MNFAQLIFGQVAFMVNFYADHYREQDRLVMVSKPEFGAHFNLPITETVGEAFDFIIVGGGTAGCLLANRLARAHTMLGLGAPFRVLLLESGGDPPPPTWVPGNAVQWSRFERIMFQHSGLPQLMPENVTRVFPAPVGRVLGGTSVLNYMFFNRGSPHDYDTWANITGDHSWSYANLRPHFKAIETYEGEHAVADLHGTTGEIPVTTQGYAPGAERFLAAGGELGYPTGVDPNGPQRIGFAKVDVNKRRGQRVSAYDAFLGGRLEELPNLEVRRHAHVNQVLFETEGIPRAVGVTYTRHGFPFIAHANREVILSAGALGSPEILLRSGVGPAEELRSLGIELTLDLPVGRNFQEHPLVPLAFQVQDGSEIYTPELNLTGSSVEEFIQHGTGPLTSVGGLAAQAFLASSHAAPDWPDLQLAAFSQNRHSLGAGGVLIYNNMVHLGRPKSRGTVKLNPTPTPDGSPLLINMNLLTDPDDVAILVEGIHAALEVYENTTAYGEIGATYPSDPLEECAHYPFRSDEYWSCYVVPTVVTAAHPCCTCPMGSGASDSKAVLDSNLRVIGAKGLRVIDASSMPVITNANIQAAVYVIAEKGAADILAEHGARPGNGAPSLWVERTYKVYLISFILLNLNFLEIN